MNTIFKRSLSSLVPPKIASPSAIGAARDAVRMGKVVEFYQKLPRGRPEPVKPSGLLQRYQARYFGSKTSGIPLLHVLGFLVAIGYAQNYYYHLRHHKNNAH